MIRIPLFLLLSGIWLQSAAADTDSNANTDSVRSTDSKVVSVVTDSVETQSTDSTVEKSTLVISTDPSEAVVIINDSIRGLSPLTISELDTGVHILNLKKKGCYIKKVEIRIDSVQKKELHFLLQQPSKLYITTVPPGASLFVNTKTVGNAPYFNKLTKPGEYVIAAEMKNYQKTTQTHVLESNVSDTLKLILKHTATYIDSIKTAEIQAQRGRKVLTGTIVGGAFALFGLVLLIIEARE